MKTGKRPPSAGESGTSPTIAVTIRPKSPGFGNGGVKGGTRDEFLAFVGGGPQGEGGEPPRRRPGIHHRRPRHAVSGQSADGAGGGGDHPRSRGGAGDDCHPRREDRGGSCRRRTAVLGET